MGPDLVYGSLNINALGSTTEDERHASIPRPSGKFRLVSAKWTPSTSLAIDGTNYVALILKKGAGGTTIASTTTFTGGTAWTKGTAIAFDLGSAGAAADFNAATATECLELAIDKTGAGAVVVDGQLDYAFERFEIP